MKFIFYNIVKPFFENNFSGKEKRLLFNEAPENFDASVLKSAEAIDTGLEQRDGGDFHSPNAIKQKLATTYQTLQQTGANEEQMKNISEALKTMFVGYSHELSTLETSHHEAAKAIQLQLLGAIDRTVKRTMKRTTKRTTNEDGKNLTEKKTDDSSEKTQTAQKNIERAITVYYAMRKSFEENIKGEGYFEKALGKQETIANNALERQSMKIRVMYNEAKQSGLSVDTRAISSFFNNFENKKVESISIADATDNTFSEETWDNIDSGRSGRALFELGDGFYEGAKEAVEALVDPKTYVMIANLVGKALGEGIALLSRDDLTPKEKADIVLGKIKMIATLISDLGDKFDDLSEEEKSHIVGEIVGMIVVGGKTMGYTSAAARKLLGAANKATNVGGFDIGAATSNLGAKLAQGISTRTGNIGNNIAKWVKEKNPKALTAEIAKLEKQIPKGEMLGAKHLKLIQKDIRGLERQLRLIKATGAMGTAVSNSIQQLGKMLNGLAQLGKSAVTKTVSGVKKGGEKVKKLFSTEYEDMADFILKSGQKDFLVGKQLVLTTQKSTYTVLRSKKNLYTVLKDGKVIGTTKTFPLKPGILGTAHMELESQNIMTSVVKKIVLKGQPKTPVVLDNALNAAAQALNRDPSVPSINLMSTAAAAEKPETENSNSLNIKAYKDKILQISLDGNSLSDITKKNYKLGQWKQINIVIAQLLGEDSITSSTSVPDLIAFGKKVQIAFGDEADKADGKIGWKTIDRIEKST